MFAHDLCHNQIEYFRNAIDLDRKDRAKRYHKSSIFNRQSSIPVYPGWASAWYNINLSKDDLDGQKRIQIFSIKLE
jgi:hypothetical protein